jgi:hypothetical protein
VNHYVRISCYQSARNADNANRRQQVLTLRKMHREQPDQLLVAEDASREVPPGHGLIGRRGVGIVLGSGPGILLVGWNVFIKRRNRLRVFRRRRIRNWV